jgi:hypothetical protein
MEIWEPEAPGTLWATPGLLRDCFTFTFTHKLSSLDCRSYKNLIFDILFLIFHFVLQLSRFTPFFFGPGVA